MYKEKELKKIKIEYLFLALGYFFMSICMISIAVGIERILSQNNKFWIVFSLTFTIIYFILN